MEGVNKSEEEDQIIWSFSSNGKYSVQSLYAVSNHRGVIPVYVHAAWKINIPPRIQIFFFVVTRDNWPREERSWTSLVFSVVRGSLFVICFFYCCVAKCCWSTISELLNSREVVNFEYVAARWVAIASKKHELYNIISSAVLLCLEIS
jgi:hypothetical protein